MNTPLSSLSDGTREDVRPEVRLVGVHAHAPDAFVLRGAKRSQAAGPETLKTTPDPSAIWRSATALHLAGFVKFWL